MILHTTDVKHLGDYRLYLAFNNGESGEVDLSDELEGEVFQALRDPALFSTVHHHPVMRTAAWGASYPWGASIPRPCACGFFCFRKIQVRGIEPDPGTHDRGNTPIFAFCVTPA